MTESYGQDYYNYFSPRLNYQVKAMGKKDLNRIQKESKNLRNKKLSTIKENPDNESRAEQDELLEETGNVSDLGISSNRQLENSDSTVVE